MNDCLIFVSNGNNLKIMANIQLMAIQVKFCIQTLQAQQAEP